MTPLPDVVSIDESCTMRQAAARVFCHAYSRYPVFGKSIHEIKGFVMSREILQALTEGQDHQPVTSICRSCLVVPASMRSDELLVRFRDAHLHLAVVQDQQQTVGLVTLEDVLEELVGDIEDEKD
jgi:putative hemolysin